MIMEFMESLLVAQFLLFAVDVTRKRSETDKDNYYKFWEIMCLWPF